VRDTRPKPKNWVHYGGRLKIRLHESWQWTSGENTKGTSVLEEL